MSHPDPNAPPDLTPFRVGDVWENPVTREQVRIVELPHSNPERRATAELTALVGQRLPGEHRHPGVVERLTVLEGELTVKIDGQIRVLRRAETALVEENVWHNWWNASDYKTWVSVQITPGDRFAHMIETLYGLAQLGHTDAKGMPHPLQLALTGTRVSDVIVFRHPPMLLQRVTFGVLAPIARWRGYRATYPQLSRTILAPRA